MDKDVRLLGVAQGWPFQEKKGSAFYHLFRKLGESKQMVEVADFNMPMTIRRLFLLSNFSTNKLRWKVKDQVDVHRYRYASNLAQRAIDEADSNYNSVLQIGSDFKVGSKKALGMKGLPLFSFHDNNFISYAKSLPNGVLDNRRKELAYHFERDVYRDLSSIFTMSKTLRESFILDFGIPEDKVVYAGFGSPFNSQDVSGKDYGSRNILFIASHSFEAKGGIDLVKAFRKARKSVPSLTLTLVGRDWGINEPGVKCIGFLDKRNAKDLLLYQRCFEEASIFVLPSHKEAFGEVFIEAMSYGLPCIGTRTGVMPELIEGNAAGYVVNPGDIDHLTSLICDLVGAERDLKRMGENGIFAVDSEYQWSTVTSRIVSQVKKFI